MTGKLEGISEQLQLSLHDLSVELKSLGIKSSLKLDSDVTDVCEALVCTSWALINLVHGSAMGLGKSCQNPCDKELMLRSENQSLELKLEHLRSDITGRDQIISKEKKNVLKIEMELKKQTQISLKQKQLISHLTAILEKQEKDYKHDLAKQEVENEKLRELVRKSLGLRSHQVPVERLEECVGSLQVSYKVSSDNQVLEETTVNRLKLSNQTLISENLMLRDALKLIHMDIYQVIMASDEVKLYEPDSHEQNQLEDSTFRLPLSYCMTKIKELRHWQIMRLHKLLPHDSHN